MRLTPLGVMVSLLTAACALWLLLPLTPLRPANLHENITIGIAAFPSELNPIYASDEFSSAISDQIFNSLFRCDSQGRPQNDLVRSCSATPGKIRLELRPNARFSNGRPLTASDVAATLELIKNPLYESPYCSTLDFITGIKRLGRYTLELTTAWPLASWRYNLTLKILCSQEIHTIPHAAFRRARLSGSGPYRLHRIIPGKSLTLRVTDPKKNPRLFPSLTYTLTPHPRLAALRLCNRETDICEIPPLGDNENRHYPGCPDIYTIRRFLKPGFSCLVFNTSQPEITREVRALILHGLNSPPFTQTFIKNQGQHLRGLFPRPAPPSPLTPPPPSPPPGKTLRLPILTNSESRTRRDFVLLLKTRLEKVGVILEPVFAEYPIFLQRLRNSRFHLAITGFILETESDVADLLSSDSPFNYSRFRSRRMDRLLWRSRTELDPNKQQRFLARAERLWRKEIPLLPLFRLYHLVGISRRLSHNSYYRLPSGTAPGEDALPLSPQP